MYNAGSSYAKKQRQRSTNGAAIVEAAGSLALLLPVLLLLMLVVIQVSEYFVLKQLIAYVARQAAHEIAYAYGVQRKTSMNTSGTSTGPANISDPTYLAIVNKVSVPGVIKLNSNAQFTTRFEIPNSPSLSQSYVTVSVRYQGGNGLPRFPWNPLQTKHMSFNSTGVTVNSSCSWPIAH